MQNLTFEKIRIFLKNKSAYRGVAIVFGLVIFILAIFATYQYMSRQSRADVPTVSYAFRTAGCTTVQGSPTCTLSQPVNGSFAFDLALTSSGSSKMSGADLIFWYSGDDVISFESATSAQFPYELVKETHARTAGGRLLHLALVNPTEVDADLAGYALIRLTFKAKKPGNVRVALVSSAATIVGPDHNGPYTVTPQNTEGTGSTGEEMMTNIFNVNLTVTGDVITGTPGTGTGTPGAGTGTPGAGTTTPGAGSGTPGTGTGTPGAGTGTPGAGTTTPGAGSGTPGVNLKDVKVNFRVRLQGITAQPRNPAALTMQVKLVEGARIVKTDQITFTPQGDGAYVADHEYKGVNINAKHAFLIKGPKHIQKKLCALKPTESIGGTYRCDEPEITFKEGANTLEATGVVLLSGDLPIQNGIIDAVDISYVRNNVGKSDTDIVARGDLNMDTIVDTQDYTLIMTALSFKYDE